MRRLLLAVVLWPLLASGQSTPLTGSAGRSPSLVPSTAPQEFLPVDEAFQLQPVEWHGERARITWRIAPGYYLYRQRLGFELESPGAARLGRPVLPAGLPYKDEHFGAVEVYRDELAVELPLQTPGATKLRVTYQGCADAGLCYPPQTRIVQVDSR